MAAGSAIQVGPGLCSLCVDVGTRATHSPPSPAANARLHLPLLSRRLHYFDYVHRGTSYCIWGLTAGMLIVIAEIAFGRTPDFQPNPPNALPYTALCFDGTKLMYRLDGGRPWAPQHAASGERDALHLAAEAAAEESPRSAAMAGAVVMDDEAAAALGAHEGGSRA